MDLQRRAEKFRQAASHLKQTGKQRRYPPELQAEALAYFQQRHSQGATAYQVVKELELPFESLRRWRMRAQSSETFRQVALVSSSSETLDSSELPLEPYSFTVLGPAGLRIERLPLSQLVALWEALS